MYVCLCEAVPESAVREAVAAGARDVEALAEAIGVCRGCGLCRELIEELLDEPPEAVVGKAA